MILENIPFEEYQQISAMNASTLVHGIKSMRHLRHVQLTPSSTTKCQLAGQAVHSLAELGSVEFDKKWGTMPAFHLDDANTDTKGNPSVSKSTKYYKQKKAEFESRNSHKTIVDKKTYDTALATVLSLWNDPIAAEALKGCDTEVTIQAELAGIPCKGRLDLLRIEGSSAIIRDIKTCQSVEMFDFGKTFARYHYGFKLAFYRELLRAEGFEVTEVELVTVESVAPHDVAVVPISEIILDNQVSEIYRLLEKYERCWRSDNWPGVANGKRYELHVPNWSMDENMGLDWSDCEEEEVVG
ncbi:MAG: PD-(D/E)XK nuclease-like domain-containing protein [Planctomycetota bacterium]